MALQHVKGPHIRQKVKIAQLQRVERAGIYAPLTMDGTLAVNNGIKVSSYVALQQYDAEYINLGVLDDSWLSHQHFVHLGLAPFRLCAVVSRRTSVHYYLGRHWVGPCSSMDTCSGFDVVRGCPFDRCLSCRGNHSGSELGTYSDRRGRNHVCAVEETWTHHSSDNPHSQTQNGVTHHSSTSTLHSIHRPSSTIHSSHVTSTQEHYGCCAFIGSVTTILNIILEKNITALIELVRCWPCTEIMFPRMNIQKYFTFFMFSVMGLVAVFSLLLLVQSAKCIVN